MGAKTIAGGETEAGNRAVVTQWATKAKGIDTAPGGETGQHGESVAGEETRARVWRPLQLEKLRLETDTTEGGKLNPEWRDPQVVWVNEEREPRTERLFLRGN